MPIRPDLKHYYGAEWRKQIRPRILKRDGHCCAFCTKPNHAEVYQIVEPGRRMWWIKESFREGVDRRRLLDHNGQVVSWDADELPLRNGYIVRVVLTVAHLDHDPANMIEENLAALCQWCHLHHDQEHHANTRATRKDQARPILNACAPQHDRFALGTTSMGLGQLKKSGVTAFEQARIQVHATDPDSGGTVRRAPRP